MKLDQIAKDLIAGARYIERHGLPPKDPHPLRAVAATLQSPYGWFRSEVHRVRYFAAAQRMHAACGLDNSDLSPEEAIDSLVAAAFWEMK